MTIASNWVPIFQVSSFVTVYAPPFVGADPADDNGIVHMNIEIAIAIGSADLVRMFET